MSLKVKALSKKFGPQIICQNFGFEMNDGEVTVLVGASGSGKTTILRMINQLEIADSGSIELDGQKLLLTGEADKVLSRDFNRKVGFVFQDFQLFSHLTIMQNIMLAPQLNQLASDDELERQAINWLDRFNLSDKQNSFPSEISGGQKQRVAIIRSLMMNPKLICFDEPTSALDANNTASFIEILTELRVAGLMILIVSHDMTLVNEVRTYAQIISNESFVKKGILCN